MAKKSVILDEFILTQEDSGSIRVFKIFNNVKGSLREMADKIGFEYNPDWNQRQLAKNLLREYGDGKTAMIGDFTITQKDNGSIETFKDFKNVKEGLREVAEKIGFEFDSNWNTRQFGSYLIDFIEQKKVNNYDVFDLSNKPIKTQIKGMDELPQSKISNLENNETQTINNNLIEDKPWDILYKRKGENNKYGFMDPEEKSWIIEPKFEDAKIFSEGFASVKYDGKWGYINAEGSWVIEPKFEEARWFSEGIAAVKYDGKWGYINAEGSWVIEPKFEEARNFSEGIAVVKFDGKWGYINIDGSWAIEPKFEEAYSFSEGFAPVNYEGKWGYITTDGNWAIEPNFEDACTFSDGSAKVILYGLPFVVDNKGLIDGQSIKEFLEKNKLVLKGWEASLKMAEATDYIAVPLRKIDDILNKEDVIKEKSYELLFFVTNGESFHAFISSEWEEIKEWMEDHEDYDVIYYSSYDYIKTSKKVWDAYTNDVVWIYDEAIDDAICEVINGYSNFNPHWPFDLIYNGEVIFSSEL